MATSTTVVVTPKPQKSVGIAILLTVLFGPLGMLYSTIAGGLIMLLISIVLGVFTMGVGSLLVWPITIIWGAVAASSHNKKQAEVTQVLTTTTPTTKESSIVVSSDPSSGEISIKSVPQNTQTTESESNMLELPENIECPQCAETIKLKANICRFCNYDISSWRDSLEQEGEQP